MAFSVGVQWDERIAPTTNIVDCRSPPRSMKWNGELTRQFWLLLILYSYKIPILYEAFNPKVIATCPYSAVDTLAHNQVNLEYADITAYVQQRFGVQ